MSASLAGLQEDGMRHYVQRAEAIARHTARSPLIVMAVLISVHVLILL